jgi:hypothetical protein
LQDMLHVEPRRLSARLQAWVGKGRPGGDLPPVNIPKMPPPKKGVDFGGTIPHEGTIPVPGPSKGPPRRKGGYQGPGGHGRRSLEAIQNTLQGAFPNFLLEPPKGAGSTVTLPRAATCHLSTYHRSPIRLPRKVEATGADQDLMKES